MSINASKLGWLKEFLKRFNIYFRVEKLLSQVTCEEDKLKINL